MEPLGVVVFSVVMATACLSVVMESIKVGGTLPSFH